MKQGDRPASIWWVGALCSAGAILMITRWANAKGLASVRLDLNGWRKRTVLYAYLFGLVSYGAVFLIRLAIGGLEVVGMPPLSHWWIALAGSLLTTFYIAFTEEIIFRGFVFSNLHRRYSTAVAVTGSLILFILFHLPKWQSFMTSPYLFHLIASGLVFTIAYVKSNTLWHSIGLHWGWNMGAFALMEYKETVVWTQQHSSFGWFDLSGWISVLMNGILIVVIMNLNKSTKLSFWLNR
jgi:membrane protease YdiL (CAAX protease family)